MERSGPQQENTNPMIYFRIPSNASQFGGRKSFQEKNVPLRLEKGNIKKIQKMSTRE